MTPLLDEAQNQAVNSGEGLVRVMAGAGTGKTTVLTSRIERLVLSGEDPASIVATTFTNKAATEMKERLKAKLKNIDGLNIRTLDSFAVRLCIRNIEASGFKDKFIIIDDDEQDVFLKKAALSADLISDEMNKVEIKNCIKSFKKNISSWKSSGLSVSDYENFKGNHNSFDDYVKGWSYYNDLLKENNMIDFSDIMIGGVNALSNNKVCFQESNKVKWLLVDEFQDTNKIQLKFIELLSSFHKNVFVVGDPDQSIYSFRKAYPSIMENIHELLPEVAKKNWTSVALITNRRCTEEILKPANLIVDYNDRKDPKVLESGRKGSEVKMTAHVTDTLEAEVIGREIYSLQSSGINLSEIAILARNNRTLQAISSKFPAMGIKYTLRGGLRFHERSEVKDIMAYVKLAINPNHELAFRRIISRPTRGLGPLASDATVTNSRSKSQYFYDALYDLSQSRSLNVTGKEGASELSMHLKNLVALNNKGVPPTDIIKYIIGNIGYSDWANELKDKPASLETSLEGIFKIAEKYSNLYDFILDSMLDSEPNENDSNSVTLSTIHGSKGLEWSHVFFIGVEDGLIPSKKSIEFVGNPNDPWDPRPSGGIQEERRLMHVAMTRAKHALYISHALSRNGQPSRYSRFIREANLKVEKPKVSAESSYGGGSRTVSKKKQVFW